MNKVYSRIRTYYHLADDLFSRIAGEFRQADLSIFHQFVPPPSGGGHQFLRALWHETEKRGMKVENNSISHTTRACLLNSFNFDELRLSRLHRNSILYVHRIDGPIDVYRGRDDGIDQQIYQVNQKFADKTIFQSRYSLEKHLELGMQFKDPTVVLNAPEPVIFHAQGHVPFSQNRKIRLIAASWSDNPKKGTSVYSWLDEHLDWERFEFTFVGRSPKQFRNIRMLSPMQSQTLAETLRQHDIYITASQNDPCSNSLLEALACGLPALYLKSGGHPEIVKQGGLGFDAGDEIPALLEKLTSDYATYRTQIDVPSIGDVAGKYLQILGLA